MEIPLYFLLEVFGLSCLIAAVLISINKTLGRIAVALEKLPGSEPCAEK